VQSCSQIIINKPTPNQHVKALTEQNIKYGWSTVLNLAKTSCFTKLQFTL